MTAPLAARGARALARAVPPSVGVARGARRSSRRRFASRSRAGCVAPWIMVDELIYSELAKSFAARRALPRPRPAGRLVRLRLPGADRAGVPALRPRSPTPTGCEGDQLGADVARRRPGILPRAARARGRRSRSRPPCSPSRSRRCVYTGTLMTENAFYPIFLCVALVLVRTLERPTCREPARACSRSACVAYETRAAGARALSRGPDGAARSLGPRAGAVGASACSTASSAAVALLVVLAAGRARALAARAPRRLRGDRQAELLRRPTCAKWLL